MPAIEIQGLVKRYGQLEAVKDISFSIKKGEIFGFLGPNGAGKTTTIQCITGLSTMSKGSIKIFGHDVVYEYLTTRKCIGLSPQEFHFDVYFNVKDMLLFQAGYFGMKKNEAEARIQMLLKMFGLEEKAKKDVRHLSGGMKRRLSIIKAMIHDPEILILDEPTAALDIDLRVELWEYLRALKKMGKTILLTTHYIEEAERLSDRIGIIHHGKMIMLDDTKKIIDNLGESIITVTAEKAKIPKGLQGKREGKKIMIWKSSMGEVIHKFQQENNLITSITEDKENLEKIFIKLTNDPKQKVAL